MELLILIQLGAMLISAPILVLIALALLLRRPVASLRVTGAAIILIAAFAAVSARDWYLVQTEEYGFSSVGTVVRVCKFIAASYMLYVVLTEGGSIPTRTDSQEERDVQQNKTQVRQNRRDIEQDAREARQRRE